MWGWNIFLVPTIPGAVLTKKSMWVNVATFAYHLVGKYGHIHPHRFYFLFLVILLILLYKWAVPLLGCTIIMISSHDVTRSSCLDNFVPMFASSRFSAGNSLPLFCTQVDWSNHTIRLLRFQTWDQGQKCIDYFDMSNFFPKKAKSKQNWLYLGNFYHIWLCVFSIV